MILDQIIKEKKSYLERGKKTVTAIEMRSAAESRNTIIHMDFAEALRSDSISIIAEIKKASPSKGIIKENFHPLNIAQEYMDNGANAISILTESQFFLGDDIYLSQISGFSTIPLLRKDFIIDTWQIYQTKCLGADALLLIASILTKDELSDFISLAKELHLQCLVEVHDESELEKAMVSGAQIVGINNRNLQTFEVSLKTTARLAPLIPSDCVIVSESGISSHEDIVFLNRFGVDAVLIGETFMKAASIKDKFMELRQNNK
ncbi:MAG: indole-3-glycerol phosphate synthase TrpC [Clostridiales bacterium]|nr:indole-3-glycerol phosphate synthase TrpC [Clostridiales bacterium]